MVKVKPKNIKKKKEIITQKKEEENVVVLPPVRMSDDPLPKKVGYFNLFQVQCLKNTGSTFPFNCYITISVFYTTFANFFL